MGLRKKLVGSCPKVYLALTLEGVNFIFLVNKQNALQISQV